MKSPALLVVVGMAALPRTVMACATCYGAADSPQTHGMNMAILCLLGVIATVLALFVAMFISFMVRERAMRGENTEEREVDPFDAAPLVEVNANE